MSRRRRNKKPVQKDRCGAVPLKSPERRRIGFVVVGSAILLGIAIGFPFILFKSYLPNDDPSAEQAAIEPETGANSAATIPERDRPSSQELDDPVKDGWSSEAFHLRAKQQLDRLGVLITSGQEIDSAECRPLVDTEFRCGPLKPSELQVVFEDTVMRVERATDASWSPEPIEGASDAAHTQPIAGGHLGAEGLAAALRLWLGPFHGAAQLRLKFKVFDVELASESATTRQYLSISGRTATGMLEQHATWTVGWRQHTPDATPRLAWIVVDDFEQVQAKSDQATIFSDCTQSVLARNACYKTQLLRGYNSWMARSQEHQFSIGGYPGIAMGDVNGDGLEDLYVCQEAGLPNLLLLGRPDGTVEDASHDWGADWLHNSRAALLVDWDNDGDQDLAVGISGGVILMSNEGQQRFQFRKILVTDDNTVSLCAADYDNDGWLDLYVNVYQANVRMGNRNAIIQGPNRSGFVLHDSNLGGRNSLYRNKGGWLFDDVTDEVSLNINNQRFSFAAAWEDFDNDGDQDLYVGNDFGRNNLYRNDAVAGGGRHFVDIAAGAGVEDMAAGMSVAWGDYDLDGSMDLYVSNMFSAAGNRITNQKKFKPDAPAQVRAALRRFARGNTLLRNLGNGTFQDVSIEAGVTMGNWAWSSNFVDLNNDGWQDLLVANGYITNEDTHDL